MGVTMLCCHTLHRVVFRSPYPEPWDQQAPVSASAGRSPLVGQHPQRNSDVDGGKDYEECDQDNDRDRSPLAILSLRFHDSYLLYL
jgi:hypothetical protein